MQAFGWGFWAHRYINQQAISTLPAPLIRFYKLNRHGVISKAVLPDQRRYAVPEEGCRHYIDMEAYQHVVPLYFHEAKAMFSEDTLLVHGMLPWNIQFFYSQLIKAFENKDAKNIIKISAEIGHYIADAHVPLHTTRNYNGQLTGQLGIHALWETRLPELFYTRYFLYTGPAKRIDTIASFARSIVLSSHALCPRVLECDLMVKRKLPENRWYEYQAKGTSMMRMYSYEYARHYHVLLNGMVEQQMKLSILAVGSIWYSAWLEAGKPALPETQAENIEEENHPNTHSTHEHSCH